MEIKDLIIVLVVAVICLAFGGAGGFYLKSMSNDSAQLPQKAEAVQTLSSKIIPSITAYGNVSKIDGRTITLSYQGDALSIKIIEGAQVYLPSKTVNDKNGKATTIPQQQAKFEDIKVGDNASINVKLLPNGQMEGQLVIILTSTK